jgi:peroxiredoxin Q/BCP
VIYFYPKDDTPGCTKEACSFRDNYQEFTDAGVTVIGISADDVESHKKFADKYNLPYTLLSDTDNKVRKLFGVKGDLFGLIPGRVTFVVDKNGVIRHVFNSQMNAEKHITESLAAIEELDKN